ncbi:hypothetical protein [Mangrovimonas aestuarii]|uniref:hypothetical protein n=1 Tax=Mangrovimonas aestuarii TaxID=3018443 RepID=UPI0023788E82|nr:hypothetical protein [Mangrovimonas aestuarii]
MKKLFFFLAVAAGATFVSCSSDDDGGASATSITLTANTTEAALGQTVTFSVTNDLGDNVTSDASYYVDGEMIASNAFTAEAPGMYTVYATDGDLQSADLEINITAPTNQVLYNGGSYAISNTALVFWGGADLDEDGAADHAYWSFLTTTGSVTETDPSTTTYLDTEIFTPLVDGNLEFPTPDNVVYGKQYELYIDGSQAFDNTATEANGYFTLDTDLNVEEAPANVSFQTGADVDGMTIGLSYDGAFEGTFDGSGGRYEAGNGLTVTKEGAIALPLN